MYPYHEIKNKNQVIRIIQNHLLLQIRMQKTNIPVFNVPHTESGFIIYIRMLFKNNSDRY